MLSGDGRTIAYTPYDLPQTITRGFSTVTFSYGPERTRTKRVDSTAAGVTTTIYAAGRCYEKITRPDGSIEQKFYIGDPGSGPGASFAVVTRPGTSVTPTDTIKYLLGDHLGSVDVIANANGTLAQKLSFDAWGKRREANWTVMIDPSQFDSTITTHGFTGHEEIDPVELVHMNGRVYDPEIGRFLSADPFVQDQSNSQSFNRYSYVLNNPLSLTDPTGFFFGSIFKAIGNFIGKVFSAIASVFKAALKIPLIRAVIQIAACAGPELTAVCVGVTGAMELVAGGSIGDAIKAMAFTVVSFNTWAAVGDILHPIEQAFSAASVVVTSAVHGVVNGALSLAQGGTFLDGFVSGAVGQTAGMLGMHSALGDIEGLQGSLARSVFAGAAGDAASELTGGKFANGFVTAAFAQMWNDELHFDGKTLSWFTDEGRLVGAYEGVSGRPGYEDSQYQDLAGYGPIPEGEWDVMQSKYQSMKGRSGLDRLFGEYGLGKWPGNEISWGSQRIWLTPRPGTNTYSRSGFTIHGGSWIGWVYRLDHQK